MYVLNSLASATKYLSEEKVLDILNGSDQCPIRDNSENNSSDKTDEYEDDIKLLMLL
jgi:hypothetical protein